MGGRGSSSGSGGGGGYNSGLGISVGGGFAGSGGVGMQQATTAAQVMQNAQNITLSNVANQAPDPNNTPITVNGAQVLKGMTDDELATLYNQSRHVDMPNHLSDVADKTQNFVYLAGINGKPMVLDDNAYDQYLKDNNIHPSQQLARSVTRPPAYTVNGTRIQLSASQCTAMIKDGELNYIGGKVGGQMLGAGTYFDMNGGRNTGYGNGATCIGVLSPQARTISINSLQRRVSSFRSSHPKFASAVGSFTTGRNGTASIYALAMGYNVITDSYSGYHNVIDRTALVMRASDI